MSQPVKRTRSRAKAARLPTGARGRPKGVSSQLAYEELRKKIIAVELPPGSNINEIELQRALGMSRTPLREALIRLEAEGLVLIESNVGARVASLNYQDIPALMEAIDLCQRAITLWSAERRSESDLRDLEAANEAFAAAVAADDPQRMTATNTEFHMAIARASRNPVLVRWYERLSLDAERFTNVVYQNTPDNREDRRELVEHHKLILSALRRRDVSAVDKALRTHSAVFEAMVRKHFFSSLAHRVDVLKVED